MDFVRANGLRKCNMMLRDQREILWTVKLNLEPRRAVIKCGCKSFLKAQEMKEGAEFMLELIRNGETPVFNFYGKSLPSKTFVDLQMFRVHGNSLLAPIPVEK